MADQDGMSLAYQQAVRQLQADIPKLLQDPQVKEICAARDDVLKRYQPIFSPENVRSISAEDFRGFLDFKNNCHWGGLQRLGSTVVADMEHLRSALAMLVDESLPLSERMNSAVQVKGMGKGVATAILTIISPSKCGVWNSTAEEGLKRYNLWPAIPRGASIGDAYVAVNEVLVRLSNDLPVDLWSLDSLLWAAVTERVDEKPVAQGAPPAQPATADSAGAASVSFGLERHLHEVLHDNWDRTELGQEWDIYSEANEAGNGYECSTGVGFIDLLCKHKTEPRWPVVELKRRQTSDDTVGQVLRYMGWVKHELAKPSDQVEGLIIAQTNDQRLLYALSAVPNVSLQLYEVEFRLVPAATQGGIG